MKNIKNILWGLVLIAIGVIWGLNELGITEINIFFKGWWTLFIIVPCFIGLFDKRDITGDIIGLGIGVILLLSVRDVIDFAMIWKLIFPIIVIVIGLSMIMKNMFNGNVSKRARELSSSKAKECCATFSSEKLIYEDEKFEGCNLTAVFGGVQCNLKEAKITKDASISTCSIFGGVDILVPEGVNVKVSSTSMFGGVSNNINNSKDNKVTIYVTSTCLFGGAHIK